MVKTVTPKTLMKGYWKEWEKKLGGVGEGKLHVLMIDAEGFDDKIFKKFMALEDIRPDIVVYERKALNRTMAQDCLDILEKYKYHAWDLKKEGNVLAIKSDSGWSTYTYIRWAAFNNGK